MGPVVGAVPFELPVDAYRLYLFDDRKAWDNEGSDEKQPDTSRQRANKAQHNEITATCDKTCSTALVIPVDVDGEPLHHARAEQARQANRQEEGRGECR